MAPAGRLDDGLLRMFPDHRAPVAQEYRRAYERLTADLGIGPGHPLRDEAARVAHVQIRAIVAAQAWGEAIEKRRVGKGRRPSERRVERLARRAALDDQGATQALDRLRELAAARRPATDPLEQMLADTLRAKGEAPA